MSLKFLTRRRDRDRNTPSSAHTHSKSVSITRSHTATDVSLPSTDSFFRKGKPAEVPSEVHIISWDQKEPSSSGRQAPIGSIADDAPPSTATPVYHAFTTRPSSTSLTSREASTSYSNDTAYSGSGRNDTSGRTFFGARNLPAHRRVESKSSPRKPTEAPRESPRDPSATLPDELASVSLQAVLKGSDTPRSDNVEELEASSGAQTPLRQKDASNSEDIVRPATKARRPKSRSDHGHGGSRMAIHGDVDVDDLSTPSFAGTPLSLPSGSRVPFSAFHRNASVSSLTSFISFGGAGDVSANEGDTATFKKPSGFLSRFPSTRRRSRRSKNASSGDAQSSASGDSDGQSGSSRARSESHHSAAPKFSQSRDNVQSPPSTTKAVKSGRLAAPPSAWRSDMAAVAPVADIYSAGGGGGTSSAYSSDNEMSVGHASSSGHGAEPSEGRTFFQKHGRRASGGDTSVSARENSSLLHPSFTIFGRITDAATKRASMYSSKSNASPAPAPMPLEPADPPISPRVSGLPLPLPSPSVASPGGTIFTAQLFQRLGPPPIGLPPPNFEDRVELIHNHVLNQACPAHPSSNPAGLGNDLSSILMSTSASSDGLYRSSLPPTPRGVTASTSSRTIRAAPYDLTTLQDEFDKLECLAEREMGRFVPTVEMLRELRLEEAFVEARRRCGVDCTRVQFEVKNVLVADDRLEPSRSMASVLGLQHGEERFGGAEMSLTPAPRRRRGTATRKSDSTGARITTPLSNLPSDGFAPQELFTPQSFSVKPLPVLTQRQSSNVAGARPSSADTHSEASSGVSRSALRSPPLFGQVLGFHGKGGVDRGSQDTEETDDGVGAEERQERTGGKRQSVVL
ncbi:hypothetical protein PSEUBRA_003613 [Kalmanozyma brasiliensis GHG001]|uniref:uncharacterized protein n=1 Tax=Kalmanozyma brasiliensis (strain GHG001) TaxID=1365824 RepID=UPI002867E108|nr:uncharacterized protein PSEUBRA_003613 [Kalmanozyma brasiliensis GHG001]KAF6767265.1 hypothetical protein PSEUBRA_003613 [Kalmanozyma brasiliensis GHG001]